MKKGQIYEGIIEKVNFPNKAIITVIDNHTVEKTEAKADSDIDSNIADTKKDSDSNVSISKNFESSGKRRNRRAKSTICDQKSQKR